MGLVGNKMKQLLSDLDDKVNNDRCKVLKSIHESVDYLNDFLHLNEDAFIELLSNIRWIYKYKKDHDRSFDFKFDDDFIKLHSYHSGYVCILVLKEHKKCSFEIYIDDNGKLTSEFKVLQLDNYYNFKKENSQYQIYLDKKLDLSELTFKDLNIIDRSMIEFIKDMNPFIGVSVEERIISAIENVYKEIEL